MFLSLHIGDPDVKMTEDSSSSTSSAPTITAVSLKLPEFWPSDPQLWFAQAEALFAAQNISHETTKFGHVVRVLPAQYASEVRDIILSPPQSPYTAIKEALMKRVCPSQRQQLQQLLHVEDLGDRKPSQLLRHMLKLRGGTATEANADPIFKQLFMDKLPLNIRTALAIHNDQSLQRLAELADAMAEIQGPQAESLGRADVCAVKMADTAFGMSEIRKELDSMWREIKAQRRPSPRPEQNRSTGYCWYHEKFGARASKCREPCTFQQQGNSGASR